MKMLTHYLLFAPVVRLVIFSLKEARWLISLRKSSVMNPKFVFWDLKDKSSRIHNDRLHAILHQRTPRSTAELSSRLYTIHYYSLKRIALPLYQILKKGEFIWDKTAMRAWNDLLYLISLRIRNYIFQPSDRSHGCKCGRAECHSNAVVQEKI